MSTFTLIDGIALIIKIAFQIMFFFFLFELYKYFTMKLQALLGFGLHTKLFGCTNYLMLCAYSSKNLFTIKKI